MSSGRTADQYPSQDHQISGLNRSTRSDRHLELIYSVLGMDLLDMQLCAFGIAQEVLEEVFATEDCAQTVGRPLTATRITEKSELDLVTHPSFQSVGSKPRHDRGKRGTSAHGGRRTVLLVQRRRRPRHTPAEIAEVGSVDTQSEITDDREGIGEGNPIVATEDVPAR